ncbi:helix-turn-helix domain-containing protein [Ruegeria sp. 2012CJ41-6]|uniref:Helix-turn-helix domain-containing protein n=1 Tax=Ruegeria spongiae TaxID=2942209 RepID=A0ABT0Q7D3_9RHOB|nr:metalloregulator ArsR/SmtB family transcription factor [Ruegeria spongiae]MCL6285735.1 helix-turn-helix domain-containing protein [Ruegeria spongiae]
MDVDDAALVLKELGHPHRLTIFRKLVKSGFGGLPVGELREELDIPNSSMTHHIASLVKAGLIVQERDGRTLLCVPQYPRLWKLLSFLESECCLECESKPAKEVVS